MRRSCWRAACSIARWRTCTIVDMRDEYAELGPEVILSARSGRAQSASGSHAASSRCCCSIAAACDGGLLPAVRPHPRLPELQRVADRPPPRHGVGARRLPLLQPLGAGARRPARNAPRRIWSRAGFGTERVEAEVRAAVPDGARGPRRSRHDAETRGNGPAVLARFGRGELDVLVGTQMIAKGHDFPAVTLVGVDLGRRGPRPRRLPCGRAHVSVADAGRRTGGPRRASRRGDHPDAHPEHYSIRLAVPPGLCRLLRGGAALSAGDALPAGRGADQRRVRGESLWPRRWGRRRISPRSSPRASPAFAVLGPGAGAAGATARRVSCAGLSQEHGIARRCASR